MQKIVATFLLLGACCVQAQEPGIDALSSLTTVHNYVQKRVSSYDRTGGNADSIPIAAGKSITIFDAAGPAEITHIWITIASPETYHLKKLVLRAYWDDEATPSIETPIGDFFGLGLGEYFTYDSIPLSVAPDKALNAFFPMPFAHHARITISNEGSMDVDSFYYNIDYRAYQHPLPKGTLYFHAQYRQQAPNPSWTVTAKDNDDPVVGAKKNLDGEGNYTWLEARGQGHFVGVTMSVLQNQDGWWGEGDDMTFIDDEVTPALNGTGAEDYLNAGFGLGPQFSYLYNGAPFIVDANHTNGRACMYRWHADCPITFNKYFKHTIEHGASNDRADMYYSVAYWYAAEPATDFPPFPPVEERSTKLIAATTT